MCKRIPRSNWIRLSYDLTSGGLLVISASKSRRSNSVALHSLQSRTSTLSRFPFVPFSEDFDTNSC